MPTVLRFRRGDTTASNAFTGAEGELFVDTSKDTVVVHDGVTAGGKPLATEAALNSKQATLVSGTNIKTINGTSILGSGDLTVTGGVSTITASGGSETTSWSLASNNWNWGDRSGSYSFYGYSVDSTFITKVGSLSSGDTVRFIGQSGYEQPLIVDSVTVQFGYFTIYLQQTESLGFSSWIAMDFTIDTSNTTVSSKLTLAKTLKFPDNSIQTTAYTGVGLATTSDLSNGLQTRQEILVSGTNIKTVNGTSILGSGNITISGGSGGSTDLTQVSSDIAPMFDSVYDLGSTTNRFYDAYLGNKLDINGATIAGSMTDPADYTLVTNATVVAPTVVADSALLGTNYFEADTITPEHILGEYTDTKGTLIVDGNLRANDILSTFKSVVLDTELVKVATVLTSTAVPEQIVDTAVDFSTSTVNRIEFLSSTPPGYPQALGYIRFYFSDANAANTPVQSLRGQTIKFSSNGVSWTLSGINGGWNEGSSFLLYYDTCTSSSNEFALSFPYYFSTNYGPGYNSYAITKAVTVKGKHTFTLSEPVTFESADILYSDNVAVQLYVTAFGGSTDVLTGASITVSNGVYTVFDTYQTGVIVSNLKAGSELYVYKAGIKALQYKHRDGSLKSLISVDTNTDTVTLLGAAVEKRATNIVTPDAITTNATNSIALGPNAQTSNCNASVAIGSGSTALRSNSVSIGFETKSNKFSAVTIGNNISNNAIDGMARVKNFMKYTVYASQINPNQSDNYLGIANGQALQVSQLSTQATNYVLDLDKINSYDSDSGHVAFIIEATMLAQNSNSNQTEFYTVRDITVLVRKNASGWSLSPINNIVTLGIGPSTAADAEFVIWNNSYLVVRATSSFVITSTTVDVEIKAINKRTY